MNLPHRPGLPTPRDGDEVKKEVSDAPRTAAELLRLSGLDALDARVLLCHALGWQRTELITRADRLLPAADVARFASLAERRRAGEPVAQLVGEREFFGRRFIVTPDVLIPRPDTELLVELALDYIDHPASRSIKETAEAETAHIAPMQVLDLGTGSGAIAVTLAAERPDVDILASDRSGDALAVAKANAQALLSGPGERPLRDAPPQRHRLQFAQGSWFDAVTDANAQPQHRCFDLIVSNPPYIASQDPHLSQGDLRFEPRGALTDEQDGLSDIRTIAQHASAWLQPLGALMVEHGYDQGEHARAIFIAAGFIDVRTVRDLGDRDRVTLGFKPLHPIASIVADPNDDTGNDTPGSIEVIPDTTPPGAPA